MRKEEDNDDRKLNLAKKDLSSSIFKVPTKFCYRSTLGFF